MKKIFISLILLGLVVACNRSRNQPRPFSTEMLPSQDFLVNPEIDTVLRTLHGSLIRIVAGSFNTNELVKLEVKEALTAAEILAAGLSTESNGSPLRSGGMIYLNGMANGKEVGLIKPIKISVPNDFYDSSMQLFKGEISDSGTVNWKDPVQIDSTPQMKNWEFGKAIFNSKCASCHNITKLGGVGPELFNVEDRGQPREVIRQYIKNPAALSGTNHHYHCLKDYYASMMTAFPDLSDSAINAVLDYIKNESARFDSKENREIHPTYIGAEGWPCNRPMDTSNLSLECGDDTIYVPVPKKDQSFIGNEEAESNEIILPDTMPSNPGILNDPQDRNTGFTDKNYTSGMYDFEIKTWGWYNIDAYMEGYQGTTSVKVWAQVRVDFNITLHVYLFCPDKQILSVANVKENDKYFFDKIKGGVPLFINDRAILFAFGSYKDKIYAGFSEFTIQGEQNISISAKEITEKELREIFQNKNINGIDLGMDKKEQKIQKKNCDENQPKDSIVTK